MTKFLILIIILPLLLCPIAQAHGVRGKVGAGGVVVTAEYDTGEPMSYAKVKILAPNSKLLFQSGRTDRNGCFCFFPDTPGTWKVIVEDEMGHRLELQFPINKRMKLKQNVPKHKLLPIFIRALMGLSFIFGIFGVFFWWKVRKTYS